MSDTSNQSRTLADWLPDDSFIGSSLIVRESQDQEINRFLYGIRPVRQESGRQVLELTGIGGKIEAQDASIGAGVIREAQEEIACAVRLLPSPQTLLVKGRKDIQLIEVAGPEKPLVIIYRHHRTPPHRPWHHTNQGAGWLVIFLAELQGRPRPESELPNLIWLPADLIYETAHRHVSLGELLVGGAALIPGRQGSPPLDTLTRLTDSQEALAITLGKTTPAFYDSLFGEEFPNDLFTVTEDGVVQTADDAERESRFPLPYQNQDIQNLLQEGDILISSDSDTDKTAKEPSGSSLGIQLEATGAILKKTRQELMEANNQIEQLASKIARLEREMESLRRNSPGWSTPFTRFWNWIGGGRRRDDG